MYRIIALIIILIDATIAVYMYRKEIAQLWKKHKKKIIALILGTSAATAGLYGIPSLEINIDDYLITSISDYESLGFNVSRIKNPIIYEKEVLCEGHLPLAFEFKDLSKSIQVNEFISASKDNQVGFNSIDLSYKILVNETYKKAIPVYEYQNVSSYRTFIDNETQEKTYENYTHQKLVQTGEEIVEDYHYIWKDLDKVTINKGDIVVIDIVGNFKATLNKRSVDIVPTIQIESYYKTYTEYAWWNSDWSYKKAITINHSQVYGTLRNFPVLINITDADLSDSAQSDGGDIAFVNSSETFQYYHDIDYFDDTTGELIAWVNITRIFSSEDTVFYMYYKNDVAPNQEDKVNTWDSHYKMVHHMTDNTTSTLECSVYNSNATKKAANTPEQIGGAIKYGQDYDNENEYTTHQGHSSILIQPPSTISFYVRNNKVSGQQIILNFGDAYIASGQNYNGLFVAMHDDDYIGIRCGDGTSGATLSRYDIWCDDEKVTNSGSYITIVVHDTDKDTDSKSFYINGSLYTGSYITDGDGNGNIDYSGSTMVVTGVAARGGSYRATYGLNGVLDEVRFSDLERNTSWINTEYNNMNNSTDGGFYTIGSEEVNDTNDPPEFSNEYPTNNSRLCNDTFTWNITISDSYNDSFDWIIECDDGQNSSGNLTFTPRDFIYNNTPIKVITSGSGNWTVPPNVTAIDALVVAGGGASGTGTSAAGYDGGGGGAGGLIWITDMPVTPDLNLSYSIGSGGVGAAGTGSPGQSGSDTTLDNLTAKGGGGGGSRDSVNARNGGSGGGAGSNGGVGGTEGTETQTSQVEWSGEYGYGNNGSTDGNGGGGGGATSQGSGTSGGSGKDMSDYFGTDYGNSGVFSSGGGANNVGDNAVANSGMGGRARASTDTGSGRDGGSGIILIRYDFVNTTNATLDLSGLSSGKHTIWVNATDGVDSTNETYYVYINYCPSVISETPINNTVGTSTQPTCSVEVSDQDGDTMNVSFYNSTDGVSFTHQQTNSSVANGTYSWEYTMATAISTDYYWRVTVDDGCCNMTYIYNFTTESSYSAIISDNGTDYFCWMGNNGTLSDVAAAIANFDSSDEYVGVWNRSTWDGDDWCWYKYYGDGSGTDANVEHFDTIKIYLTNSGSTQLLVEELLR